MGRGRKSTKFNKVAMVSLPYSKPKYSRKMVVNIPVKALELALRKVMFSQGIAQELEDIIDSKVDEKIVELLVPEDKRKYTKRGSKRNYIRKLKT